MKFTTAAGDLYDALTLARRVIPKTPTLSVFSGVHLVVSGQHLSVTGSAEQETTVVARVPVAGAKPGSAVLLPKPIADYLHTLPVSTPIEVSAPDQTKVVVHAEGGNPYTFRAMDSTFPKTATGSGQARSANLTRLAAAVAAVREAAKKNKLVQLVSDETGLALHATDNLRLTRAHLPEAGFGPFNGLVPLGVLELVAEVPVTEVLVEARGRVLTLRGEKVTVTTRLVDDVFPDFNSILANTPAHTATVNAGDVRQALTRLASVTEERRPLLVTLAADEMVLQMDSANLGSGVERLELTHPATGEVTLALNMDFLTPAVNAHAGGQVTFAWFNPEQPVFLSSAQPLAVTNVIAPMRL
jgi:DNA polymerase III sliding clamp (beta) subunit (PCNA family)